MRNLLVLHHRGTETISFQRVILSEAKDLAVAFVARILACPERSRRPRPRFTSAAKAGLNRVGQRWAKAQLFHLLENLSSRAQSRDLGFALQSPGRAIRDLLNSCVQKLATLGGTPPPNDSLESST